MKNLYDHIERYLQDELSETEQLEFENALKTDKALYRALVQHRELMERLESLRLRKKVKKALAPSQDFGSKSKPFFTTGVIGAIVAILLVLAATLWSFNKKPEAVTPRMVENQSQPTPSPGSTGIPELKETVQKQSSSAKPSINREKLLALAREFQIEPPGSFIRDAEETTDPSGAKTPRQMAAEYFQKGNYTLAAEVLRTDDQVAGDEKARYLRGLSRFRIGQYAGAAADFEVLHTSFRYKHDARWNHLLCQLAMGKVEMVNVLLTEMVADQDFPFHKNAVALKAKL